MRRSGWLLLVALAAAVVVTVRWPSPTPRARATLAPESHAPVPAPLRPTEGDEPPAAARGLRLEGQVLDPAGAPLTAEILVQGRETRRGASEADGSFAFDGLAAGDYVVVARAGEMIGFQSAQLGVATEPVIITVSTGAQLRVRVRDGRGDAVVGAELFLAPLRIVARSEPSGDARLAGIPPGRHYLQVRAPGFATTQVLVSIAAGGSGRELDVVLARGARVSGTIRDPDGQPLAGAEVLVRGLTVTLTAPSGEAGDFVLDGLAEGTALVVARHPAFAPSEVVTVTARPGEDAGPIELTVQRGRAATGKVLDATDQPVADALVTVSDGSDLWTARSDAEGRFALTTLPAGRLEASARRGSRSSRPVAVGSEALVLRLPAAMELAGVVVDDGGATVARARVLVTGEPTGVRRQLVAGEDGRFQLDDLEAGSYRLRADWPDARHADRVLLTSGVVARAGDREVRLVLSRVGALRGRVVLAGGAPGPFTVRVGEAMPVPFAEGAGEFTVDEIPAGRHWVQIAGPGFQTTTLRDVELARGETTDLGLIQVARGRRAVGVVVDAAGDPVAGARIFTGTVVIGDGREILPAAQQPELSLLRATESGPDGSFVVPGLPHTGGVLVAEDAARGRSFGVVVPPGDADVELRLALSPRAPLEGTLADDEAPLPGRFVVASPAGRGNLRFSVTTDGRGKFRFDGLAPGRYVVSGQLSRQRLGCAVHAVAEVDAAGGMVTLRPPAPRRPVELRFTAPGVRLVVAYLVPGERTARTPAEAEALAQDVESGLVCTEVTRSDRALRLAIGDGTATACVVSAPFDPGDPAASQRFAETVARAPVTCERVAPTSRELSLALP